MIRMKLIIKKMKILEIQIIQVITEELLVEIKRMKRIMLKLK
jgi:hypothetical protein